MIAGRENRKGQPLIFLALVLVTWIGVRTSSFQTPWSSAQADELPVRGGAHTGETGISTPQDTQPVQTLPPAGSFGARNNSSTNRWPHRAGETIHDLSAPARQVLIAAVVRSDTPADIQPPETLAPQEIQAHGFQANATVAPSRQGAAPDAREYPNGTVASEIDRWRMDGWLLLRGGRFKGTSGGQQAPSYGASQLGAVLTFRFVPRSPRMPSAYLRVSDALIDRGESEAALGLSLRPLPRIPLTAHAELRATRRPGGTELRPAALVSGGFERDALPLRLGVRGYAAAGYVGGDFATAFIDAQAAVEAEVVRFDLGALRVGAGSWGGAQRGSARVDVGPTASLKMKVGDAPVRLSLDYRQRIAGDAAPASGAALTLSTGF